VSCIDLWSGADDGQVAEPLARHVVERFSDPFLTEALHVASPPLARRWSLACGTPGITSESEWIDTLARYFSRACTRATPFGVFAGVTAGKVDAQTELRLNNHREWRRRTRLDHEYILQHIDAWVDARRDDPATLYSVNSTLYRVGEDIRYWIPTGSGDTHHYRHAQARLTPPIDIAISCCANPCSKSAIVQELATQFPGAQLTELHRFIDELIRREILVNAQTVCLTYLREPDEFIRDIWPCAEAAGLLKAQRIVCSSDGTRIGEQVVSCDKIAGELPTLEAEGTATIKIQVDTEIAFDALTVGVGAVEQVAEAVDLWWSLCSDVSDDDPLDRLAARFASRWGDVFVPLALALDDDIGLAFASPTDAPDHLRTLDLQDNDKRGDRPLNGAERWLLRRISAALEAGDPEVALSHADAAVLRSFASSRIAPPAIAVVLSIYESTRPGSGNPTLWLENISNSATAMSGRFCAVSSGIYEAVRHIVSCEQLRHPDAVLAEIVHLPRPKSGNVIKRPVLREYEIPYAGTSGAPHERQLGLNDLYVGLDKSNRFIVWSKRLNRRVIPMLSSAHNFALDNSLAIYRFLCNVAAHATSRFTPILADADYFSRMPRIRFGDCVLRAASWTVVREEFEQLRLSLPNAAVEAWSVRRGLPRLTTYGPHDQMMVLDLRNPILVRCFLNAKHVFPLVLKEASPNQAVSLCRDREGEPHRHEIVLPMLLRSPQNADGIDTPQTLDPPVAYIPGGRWLSLKIYGGTRAIEQLLLSCVPEWIELHRQMSAEATWFYVRYADPEHHLRLRFAGDPDGLLVGLLPAIHARIAPLLSEGRIARVQVDTYVPEISRYGGLTVLPLIERLFHADSTMNVNVLADERFRDAEKRLEFGMWSILALLRDFRLSDAAALKLVTLRASAMVAEFGGSSGLKKQIGDQYRAMRSGIADTCSNAAALCGRRSSDNAPLVEAIEKLRRGSELNAQFDSVLASLMHMSLNRLFASHPRQQEMLVYEFAKRHLTSRTARARNQCAANTFITS